MILKETRSEIALFTDNIVHLRYNETEHECEAISGKNDQIARNCPMSTVHCIVMQMSKVICEKGYCENSNSTRKVAKITLVSSVLGVACCTLQIYSLFGVYGVYSKAIDPKPWPWWVFQTSFRLVELAMRCTIA